MQKSRIIPTSHLRRNPQPLTIASLDDVDAVLAGAHPALHVEVESLGIAGVLVDVFTFGDVVPLVRLFAAVGALDFQEERIIRMARFQLLDVLEGGLDLETDFHHDLYLITGKISDYFRENAGRRVFLF